MKEKKYKIHLLASPHPQFDEILDFPPKGVEYKKVRSKMKYHSWLAENRINLHNKLISAFPLPRMSHIKTDADLIHSTRGIIIVRPNKPWIVDLESGGVFTSFNYKAMKNPLIKKVILFALTSKKCKKILPQSEAARKDFEIALGKDYEKVKDKVEVLYLAMRPYKKKRKKRKDNKVKLSFIGNSFCGKGGHDLLNAYRILTKKYKNLELKFKCDGEIPKKYQNLKIPGLKYIKEHFSRDKLFKKMYLDADIFVLPTHTDNYGVVFLEAMSVGLPIIGTTSFTVPELIEDGKNGFLIKTPYSWENYIPFGKSHKEFLKDIEKDHPEIIRQLVEKLSVLIEDKRLRKKMGKESRKIIEKGKLSIKERNKKLKEIYEEALKN